MDEGKFTVVISLCLVVCLMSIDAYPVLGRHALQASQHVHNVGAGDRNRRQDTDEEDGATSEPLDVDKLKVLLETIEKDLATLENESPGEPALDRLKMANAGKTHSGLLNDGCDSEDDEGSCSAKDGLDVVARDIFGETAYQIPEEPFVYQQPIGISVNNQVKKEAPNFLPDYKALMRKKWPVGLHAGNYVMRPQLFTEKDQS